MKVLLLGLGKFLFQLSVIFFVIGYCLGIWFKRKDEDSNIEDQSADLLKS